MKSTATYLGPRDFLSSRRKAVKYMRQLTAMLIVLSPLALADVSYAASRVFYDDFEDGTTNKWVPDGFRNRCQVVTSSSDGLAGPYAGSYMARCNSNGVVEWTDPTAYETMATPDFSFNNEFFCRGQIRIDSNNEPTSGSAQKFLRLWYWDGTNYHDLFVTSYPSGWGQNCNVRSGCSGGQIIWPGNEAGRVRPHPEDKTRWHSVEYYINYATGKIRVWYDHLLIRDDPAGGVNFGDGVRYPWTPLNIISNWGDSHDATNHVYFDNIEVYSDIGTGATGLMSDASITDSGNQQELDAPTALKQIIKP